MCHRFPVREWLRAADDCCGTVGAGRWSSFEQFSVENSQINYTFSQTVFVCPQGLNYPTPPCTPLAHVPPWELWPFAPSPIGTRGKVTLTFGWSFFFFTYLFIFILQSGWCIVIHTRLPASYPVTLAFFGINTFTYRCGKPKLLITYNLIYMFHDVSFRPNIN